MHIYTYMYGYEEENSLSTLFSYSLMRPLIPLSVDEYKGTFIPMILEECRACCSASTSRVAQMDQDEVSKTRR